MSLPSRATAAARGRFAALEILGESKTKQSFKEECDINVIMKRYSQTGVLPPGVGIAKYGDFAEVPDYIEAQNTLIQARQQFEALPSRVRDRFRNDPANMLAFVNDKKNKAEARVLGLLKDEEPVIPVPEKVDEKKKE